MCWLQLFQVSKCEVVVWEPECNSRVKSPRLIGWGSSMRSPPAEENHECALCRVFTICCQKALFLSASICSLWITAQLFEKHWSFVGFVDPGQITGSFCRHQIVNISDVDVEIRKCKNNSQYQILMIIEHIQLKFYVHRSRLLRAPWSCWNKTK